MKSWHVTNPTLYHEVEQIISAKYPSLHVLVENETVCIRGTFPLFDPDTGREIDRYWIEIWFPRNFPKSVPVVLEIG